MNRFDLHYALAATLPHVGRTEATGFLGLDHDGKSLYAYATDKYTSGVCSIPDGPHLDVRLSVGEATDLMRFVRPTLKATLTEDVITAVQGSELHVALADSDDSAVFETLPLDAPGVDLPFLRGHLFMLLQAPREFDQCTYWPDILVRFHKAKRDNADRMRVSPRRWKDTHGAALVTIGDRFIGSIAGMTYDEVGDQPIVEFLAAM